MARLQRRLAAVSAFGLCTLGPAASLPAQERISLNGAWTLRKEPLDESHLSVLTTTVPSAFETTLGPDFDGVAWYRRTLPVDASMRGASIRVAFAAVATHATVFCNGVEVGQHLGGWTPFQVDVTNALQWQGNDVLEVRVDEKVGHNTQGFLPIIQPHFGGIWQDVALCVDGPVTLDRERLFVFGQLAPDGTGLLQVRAPLRPIPDIAFVEGPVELSARVFDGAQVIASATWEVGPDDPVRTLSVPAPRPWRPGAPHLYRVAVQVQSGSTVPDEVERRVGFRSLRADGTKVLWNGAPLQVRGVLHWGYSPPHLAPPTDAAHWRRQIEDFRSLGFNTLKCCLWVPPPCVYDLCDELGMLVWQEYPTWHPQMDLAHKDELLREYAEFFALDGGHPSVAFRSLTCETGHGADLDVVKSLFDACHAAVPDTLVVDDSSWIGWQRVTDFWDEHPYGNNRWWPGRLAEFRQHIAEKGQKPLLLGECNAADTWADRAAWTVAHGDAAPWWRPNCLQDQARFESWITTQFGEPTLSSLRPLSLDYAMRTRRYQIERLRMTIPEAGYVVSVARDFGKARMGLYDDFDRLKWAAADWRWQGDRMLCLDTEGDRRAFVTGAAPVVLHARTVQGTTVSDPVALAPLPRADRPARHCVTARDGGLEAAWDVWLLPPFDDARPAGVRVVDRLDLPTLDFLEQGGRVYLQVVDRKHSLRSEGKWWLTGAPFAPPHPVHAALPAAMLIELQPFDLDGGRVMPAENLVDQVDPILAFWETHDIAEVRTHLFAFDCRVGQGRLLASCLDHDTEAGRYVLRGFLQHLAAGPAPQRALSAATIAALRGLLTEKKLDLPVWRFRTDPQDQGLAARWQDPKTDATTSDWRDLKAGSHWENQAQDLEHYTGIAWYRVDVEIPADWNGLDARAVFEGVDDSFVFWLDGQEFGRFGDPATNTTIWLERQVAELGRRLAPGRHTLVLRVVDHAGAGGLWKPVFLTTGPADARSTLLQ